MCSNDINHVIATAISKEKLYIIGVVDDKDPAANTFTQDDLHERPNICIVLFDAIHIKLPADPTVGVLKAGGIQRRNTEDRAVWVLVTNPKHRL
ncbi:hypothetical protein LZL87_003684 [Fusarium oxysporum]|nr:hypothetical protein LZL87_003684 [Fusarium oxysporum]